MDDVADLLRVAVTLHEVYHDRGVDIAASGTHQDTLSRTVAHRGVDRFAAVYRGDRAAVAEMAGDYLKVFDVLAEDLRGAVRHITVAGAMETVAADAVFLIAVIGSTVDEGLRRHRLMEGGVEDDDVRLSGKDVHDGLESLKVGGIVKRREGDDLFDALDDFRRDEHRLGEFFAAVDYTVARRVKLVEILEHAELRIDEDVEDVFDGRRVVGERNFARHRVHTGLGVLDARAFDTDTLDEPLRKDLFAVHFDELILQRRAAAIENKNFH